MNNKYSCVSVIIPAHNEEDLIGDTLQELINLGCGEIIVVDDGSTDRTAEIAADFAVQCIELEDNKGKGEALSIGLQQALGTVIVALDADLGSSVIEVEKLLQPVLENEVAVTIGKMSCTGGGLGLVRWLADRGLEFLTGKKLQAPLSGQRVFRKDVVKFFQPLASGFGLETGMNIDMLRRGIPYREIEVNIKHRVSGQTWSGYLHRGRQFWAILKTLWRKRSLKIELAEDELQGN